MKRWSAFLVVLVVAVAGCSSNPKHLSAAAFQQRYEENKGNSMEGYTYLGETNGAVYMLRRRVPLVFGSKPHEKTFFTETNALPPSFIEELRHEKKVDQPVQPPGTSRSAQRYIKRRRRLAPVADLGRSIQERYSLPCETTI